MIRAKMAVQVANTLHAQAFPTAPTATTEPAEVATVKSMEAESGSVIPVKTAMMAATETVVVAAAAAAVRPAVTEGS